MEIKDKQKMTDIKFKVGVAMLHRIEHVKY